MKFQPLSDEELSEHAISTRPLCDGFADFFVSEAQEVIATTGNEMIKLKLVANGEHGGQGVIFDNLVFTPKAQWKIKQFLCSIGLGSQYRKGEIDVRDCLGASGKCRIKNKPGTQWFEIAEYINGGKTSKANIPLSGPMGNPGSFEEDDDQVPF